MAEQSEAVVESKADKGKAGGRQTIGLLFELENVAVRGRAVLYEVVKSALAERDAELTPLLFTRHCLDASPAAFSERLLDAVGKQRSSADKLADDITKGMALSLSDGAVQIDKGFKAVVDKAVEEGLALGALTGLEESTALSLMERLELSQHEMPLYSYAGGASGAPGSDCWRKLAKLVRVAPTMSIALTSGRATCRAALVGGMRCIVTPDAHTDFQDFSGADAVVENLDTATLDDVLRMVRI